MSLLKRLSATIVSRVDQMVSQIENHDAVVEAAIRESRQAAAKARVRLSRVRGDGEKLQKRIAELRASQTQWTERARSVAADDRDRALECMRRRNECLAQIGQLEKAAAQHTQMERKLAQDIDTAERKLNEMTQQRNLMRSREAAAQALNSLTSLDSSLALDVADTMERWEVKVAEAELQTNDYSAFYTVDTLEHGFIETEERAALQAELQTLLSEGGQGDDH